ncbi:MAG: nitroreductase [Pseudonocardiales bacterium]|nr:MAG: nitroreductase [Pseudonocardiales bacterium]
MALPRAALGASTQYMVTLSTPRDTALHAAVARAMLAPSVHNTQPWQFRLSSDGLDLFIDRSRQLAVLDPTGRQLCLSAGSALLNARVSLAASACPVSVRRFPDRDRPDLVARIEASIGVATDPVLAALDPVVELRQTNRRRFAADPVPAELVATLVSAAAAEGAVLHPVVHNEDRQTLARLSQRADAAQNVDAAYRAELRAWTSNDPTRLDGVRAAAVPHVDGTAGDDVPIRDFDSQGAGWLPSQTHSSASQCLLVLATAADTPQAWVQAGEALERVWLEITRAGFVASLFTQVIEVAALRAQLRDELRLGAHPHLVLRVGRAPVTAASMRRHIGDVLDDRTDQRRVSAPLGVAGSSP